jgi:hypothetical protein
MLSTEEIQKCGHAPLNFSARRNKSVDQAHRLLVIPCSRTKRPNCGELPALERYDSPPFRLLRKFKRNIARELFPDVYIISGKFGLIAADALIPNYDVKLTIARARVLNPQILNSFKEIVQSKSYRQIFLCLAGAYHDALSGYEIHIPKAAQLIVSSGSQGKKLSDLYDWLYATPPAHYSALGKTVIRGVVLTLTPGEVLRLAREHMAVDNRGIDKYQTWYVLIDEERVSTKWLIGKLTGLPVSKFGGTEARRALEQLGVKVERI